MHKVAMSGNWAWTAKSKAPDTPTDKSSPPNKGPVKYPVSIMTSLKRTNARSRPTSSVYSGGGKDYKGEFSDFQQGISMMTDQDIARVTSRHLQYPTNHPTLLIIEGY